MCAIASKSYGGDVRNMAKNGRMTIKYVIVFQYFNPFPTPLPHMPFNSFLYLYILVYILLGVGKIFDYLCNRAFFPDISTKISNFSKTLHTIQAKFCTVILYHIMVLSCTRASKSYDWDSSEFRRNKA